MLKEIAKNIWTVEGPDVVFAGASMHTRMTIVRLGDGGLWIHSPIDFSSSVQMLIDELGGAVTALVAPNKFHHLFIGQWMDAFPQASVFAEAELKRKVLFQEAVFFHRQSRTLLLTDLMINLKTDGIKPLPKLFLKFEAVTFPNGGVPRLYRWFTLDKTKAREALSVIQKWAPERLTFCHGEPFSDDAEKVIRREFDWLSR